MVRTGAGGVATGVGSGGAEGGVATGSGGGAGAATGAGSGGTSRAARRCMRPVGLWVPELVAGRFAWWWRFAVATGVAGAACATATSRLKAGAKTYVALCHGAAHWSSRSVDGPIGWSSAQRRRWVVQGGKNAHTKVEVIARAPRHCAVLARPQPGRTHQVRIHLSSIGHPLLGERRYRRRACRRLGRPALHLAELRLPGLPRLVVPAPDDMLQVASELRLELPATVRRSAERSSGGK